MESCFFNFEAFDSEIEKKIASLKVSSDIQFHHMAKRFELSRGLAAPELNVFYEHLKKLSFDHLYEGYLSHPIRVGDSYRMIKGQITSDEMIFSLCHNIIEAGLLNEIDPDGCYLNSEHRLAISILTIDRSQEKDPVYVKAFYDRIEGHSQDLILFKALDKLDNVLSFVLMDLEDYHYSVILDEVCPRLMSVHGRLAEYLRNLTLYVKDPVVKSRYRIQDVSVTDDEKRI